jgi:hypothetical protein
MRFMSKSKLIELNGKQVTIRTVIEPEAPPAWDVKLSDSDKAVTVEVPYFRDQMGYVKNSLKAMDDPYRGPQDFHRDFIASYFAGDWGMIGGEDLAYSIAMDMLGYDDETYAQDEAEIHNVLNKIGVKRREAALVDLFLPYATDSFSVQLRNSTKRISQIYAEIDKLIIEVEEIEFRRNLHERKKAGKTIGAGWSNKLFFEKYGKTEEAKAIRVLLDEAGVKI